jgi:hypothetical protein
MGIDTGRAGRLFARLTVAPALLLVAWLAAGLPLLFAGFFRIGPVLALFVPIAALVLWLGLRDGRGGDVPPENGPAAQEARVSWRVVAGVVAVSVGFLVFQLVMVSEQIIVRRDPASYVQFATWLADRGSLPIPQMRWAFGGDDPALSYGSPAFYERGGVLVPQFMAGLPMILAAGHWAGGTPVLLAMSPILGACAVLSFGGLTARLVGPRWAPLGALTLAATLPVIYISRATYSEGPALVLLLGALCLAHDVRMSSGVRRSGEPPSEWSGRPRNEVFRGASEKESATTSRSGDRESATTSRSGEPPSDRESATTSRRGQVRVRAVLAGLAFGLIILVRIDGIRDLLPVVVFAGLLVARRRDIGLPLFAGLAVGAGAGLAEGYVLSRPYLEYLSGSLDPLLLMATAIVMMTVVMVTVLWWPPTGRPLRRLGAWAGRGRVPDLAAPATVLVVIAFAVRPYFQTVTRTPLNSDDRLNATFIKALQTTQGLPIQPDRTYDEISLYWVVWYLGLPALLMATFGAALLARRLLRRYSTEWVLPYAMIVWTTVTTLLRPGITPDHPWASRRLAALVIPGLVLFALWALAWIVRRVRRTGYSRQVTGVVAASGAIVVLLPVAAASGGVAVQRTEQGEVAAVRGLCAAIGPNASVVIAERVTADRFAQVIRGMCGAPVARVPRADRAGARRVIGKIAAVGRRPVILGANESDVAPYGPARLVVNLVTRQDEHSLVTPPDGTWGMTIKVWMAPGRVRPR